MKPRSHPLLRLTALASCTIALNQAHAASVAWVGDTDNVFDNAANWPTDTLPSLSTDTWQINGLGSVNLNPNLTLANPLAFTGTAGKIAFGASAPAMEISGGSITLFTATGDAILLASGSTVTQTISSSIILGDGTAGTTSLSNSSITGGLLKVTGSITGGTGAATAGTVTLSFGSTDSQDGNYEVTGNITKGATATALNVTMRGDGTSTLSGTNSFNTLVWGSTAGTIGTVRINGGTTDIGSIKSSGLATQTLRVSNGTLNASDARQVRTSILVDGGTLNIVAGDRLSTNNANQSLTISSGALNHNVAGGFGVRLGSDSGAAGAGYNFTGSQSGGTFTVVGAGGQDSVFSLGSITAGAAASYSLSGGTLDIQSNGGLTGWLTLGADNTAGTSTTTFALSGTGKLICRTNPANTSGGINGKQATAAFAPAQIFSMTGGTLFAGRIDGSNLRATALGTNGALVNNGTKIAPGDVGSSGTTKVVNTTSVALTSGSLAIDIGGTTASTALQDAAASSKYDQLNVTGGTLTLGGTLDVSLIDGFASTITSGDAFTILTNPSITGTFSNVSGGKVTLAGGATFDVTVGGTTVVLSNYTAPSGNTAPTITDITDQSVPSGGATGALAFTIGDETPGTVVPTGTSSNLSLVPNGNIVFGGSGASRTVTVTPVSGLSGTATITVTLTDAGSLTATDTFVLTVTDNYLSWSTANGVTGGPNGDSDNDGVSNLVEYALVNGGERGVFSGNTITFTKRAAPYGTDLTYDIESSTLLTAASWSTLAKPIPVTETAGSISYTFTPGSPVKNFARLKVTKAP